MSICRKKIYEDEQNLHVVPDIKALPLSLVLFYIRDLI